MALPLLRILANVAAGRGVAVEHVDAMASLTQGSHKPLAPAVQYHGLWQAVAAAPLHTSACSSSNSSGVQADTASLRWSDRIHLKGARFWGNHGALAEVRKAPGPAYWWRGLTYMEVATPRMSIGLFASQPLLSWPLCSSQASIHHTAQENKLGQPFEVDATVYCDLRAAGTSDELAKTINYADVYRWGVLCCAVVSHGVESSCLT